MIHKFKITTTAYNGSLIPKNAQYAYLRKPPFTVNSVTGVETSFANYEFNVLETNFYQLYNGSSPASVSLNTGFSSSLSGKPLVGDDYNIFHLTGTTSNIQEQINSGGGGGSNFRYELVQAKIISSRFQLTDDETDTGFWKKFGKEFILNKGTVDFWDYYYNFKYWRISYRTTGSTDEPTDFTELTKFATTSDLVDFINNTVPFDDSTTYFIRIEMFDKVNFVEKKPKVVKRSSLFSLMSGRNNWFVPQPGIAGSYINFFTSQPATWTTGLAETFGEFYNVLTNSAIDFGGGIDNSIISSSNSNKKNIFGYPDSGSIATFSKLGYNPSSGIIDTSGLVGTAQNSFIFCYNPKVDKFNCFGYVDNTIMYYDTSISADHRNNLTEMMNSFNVIITPVILDADNTIAFKYNVANMDSFFVPIKEIESDDLIELKLSYKKSSRYVSMVPFSTGVEWKGYNLNSIENIPQIKYISSNNSAKIYEKASFCIRHSNGERTSWIPLFKILRNKKYFPIRFISEVT